MLLRIRRALRFRPARHPSPNKRLHSGRSSLGGSRDFVGAGQAAYHLKPAICPTRFCSRTRGLEEAGGLVAVNWADTLRYVAWYPAHGGEV